MLPPRRVSSGRPRRARGARCRRAQGQPPPDIRSDCRGALPRRSDDRRAARLGAPHRAGRRSAQPIATYMNVRSVCALLACVTTNEPFDTVPIYIVPFFHSPAAFAVVGKHSTDDPEPQFVAVTVVVAALAARVNVPTAFDRPSHSWRKVNTILARSRSDCATTWTLTACPPGQSTAQRCWQSSRSRRPECAAWRVPAGSRHWRDTGPWR